MFVPRHPGRKYTNIENHKTTGESSDCKFYSTILYKLYNLKNAETNEALGHLNLVHLKEANFNEEKKQKLVSELFKNITGDENCLVASTV